MIVSRPSSYGRSQSIADAAVLKKLLKTHLFSRDCGALVTVAFTAPCTNISTTTTILLLISVSFSASKINAVGGGPPSAVPRLAELNYLSNFFTPA